MNQVQKRKILVYFHLYFVKYRRQVMVVPILIAGAVVAGAAVGAAALGLGMLAAAKVGRAYGRTVEEVYAEQQLADYYNQQAYYQYPDYYSRPNYHRHRSHHRHQHSGYYY